MHPVLRRIHALITFLLITVALAAPATSYAQSTIVAVFPVEVSGVRLKASLLDALTDYVSARIASTEEFSVVPAGKFEEALRRLKIKSYDQCYDESCQVALGAEVAAQQMVNTKIIGIGNTCSVSITFFDLRTSASAFARTVDGRCRDDELFASIRRALSELDGSDPPPPIGASGTPSGPRKNIGLRISPHLNLGFISENFGGGFGFGFRSRYRLPIPMDVGIVFDYWGGGFYETAHGGVEVGYVYDATSRFELRPFISLGGGSLGGMGPAFAFSTGFMATFDFTSWFFVATDLRLIVPTSVSLRGPSVTLALSPGFHF